MRRRRSSAATQAIAPALPSATSTAIHSARPLDKATTSAASATAGHRRGPRRSSAAKAMPAGAQIRLTLWPTCGMARPSRPLA
ncbi:MAG: hypothetical protein QM792_11845 [Piscinibacter sp.]